MKTIIEIANEQGWDDTKLLSVVTDWILRDAYREQSVTYHAQFVADAENPDRQFEVEVVFTVTAKNEDGAADKVGNIITTLLDDGNPHPEWDWNILDGAVTAVEDHDYPGHDHEPGTLGAMLHEEPIVGVPCPDHQTDSAHSEQDNTTGRNDG